MPPSIPETASTTEVPLPVESTAQIAWRPALSHRYFGFYGRGPNKAHPVPDFPAGSSNEREAYRRRVIEEALRGIDAAKDDFPRATLTYRCRGHMGPVDEKEGYGKYPDFATRSAMAMSVQYYPFFLPEKEPKMVFSETDAGGSLMTSQQPVDRLVIFECAPESLEFMPVTDILTGENKPGTMPPRVDNWEEGADQTVNGTLRFYGRDGDQPTGKEITVSVRDVHGLADLLSENYKTYGDDFEFRYKEDPAARWEAGLSDRPVRFLEGQISFNVEGTKEPVTLRHPFLRMEAILRR